MLVRELGVLFGKAPGLNEMTSDAKGEVLGKRAELGTSVGVQFLAGDLVGQDRVVVLRSLIAIPEGVAATRAIPVPIAVARLTVRAAALVRTPGTTAAPVPVSLSVAVRLAAAAGPTGATRPITVTERPAATLAGARPVPVAERPAAAFTTTRLVAVTVGSAATLTGTRPVTVTERPTAAALTTARPVTVTEGTAPLAGPRPVAIAVGLAAALAATGPVTVAVRPAAAGPVTVAVRPARARARTTLVVAVAIGPAAARLRPTVAVRLAGLVAVERLATVTETAVVPLALELAAAAALIVRTPLRPALALAAEAGFTAPAVGTRLTGLRAALAGRLERPAGLATVVALAAFRTSLPVLETTARTATTGVRTAPLASAVTVTTALETTGRA
ncbi:hypothetical protein [Actinomadura barringtoniae]|uniref:hypothetical protein n=1 Tax=Actinomadura barringtoniae TaxID=1427535 RepID=UPI001FB852E0|nr:hypothetical protein [Actinomadura barringtoniae]